MHTRLLLFGIAAWIFGTVVLRLAGQRLLRPRHDLAIVLLFIASFAATAWLVRAVCRRVHLRREDWPAGAVSLLLPTLVLDPFSSAFFPAVFPNMAPEAAGLFGGWMLCFCAGGLVGATVGARPR